ncbi:hypothetical protein cypCar_00030232 [Cyprinus carpio]|nr:hypothetical protein cypCar_00030232 [Cyprinus carpio]
MEHANLCLLFQRSKSLAYMGHCQNGLQEAQKCVVITGRPTVRCVKRSRTVWLWTIRVAVMRWASCQSSRQTRAATLFPALRSPAAPATPSHPPVREQTLHLQLRAHVSFSLYLSVLRKKSA